MARKNTSTTRTMMRIAIAGSGGLAQVIALHINETVHPFIILSRNPQPGLEALGYQVSVVNYDSQQELQYALRGIDLVISTVSGTPQINLIDAAATSGVARFIPAEFEGPVSRRPADDPLDHGRDHQAIMERLRHWSHRSHPMRYTVFSPGVFYERFARGGLSSLGIGASTGVYYQGSYLMDVEYSTAEVVERNASGQQIYLCLTSVQDLGRFIVAALELDIQTWPSEFKMQGDRLTVNEVVRWGEYIKGGATFSTEIIQARHLPTHLEHATYYQDYGKMARIQELIATERRRYDFSTANLNELVDVVPVGFGDWLRDHWGSQ